MKDKIIIGLILLSYSGIALCEIKNQFAKAEDIVTFRDHSFACDTKEDLIEFTKDLDENEQSLGASMIENSKCVIIPEIPFRILSTENGLTHDGYIQFTDANNRDASSGYWSYNKFIKTIK